MPSHFSRFSRFSSPSGNPAIVCAKGWWLIPIPEGNFKLTLLPGCAFGTVPFLNFAFNQSLSISFPSGSDITIFQKICNSAKKKKKKNRSRMVQGLIFIGNTTLRLYNFGIWCSYLRRISCHLRICPTFLAIWIQQHSAASKPSPFSPSGENPKTWHHE